jgi:hypothetical protein
MKNSRTILSTAINDPSIASNRTESSIVEFLIYNYFYALPDDHTGKRNIL